jgi:hypothetical protein
MKQIWQCRYEVQDNLLQLPHNTCTCCFEQSDTKIRRVSKSIHTTGFLWIFEILWYGKFNSWKIYSWGNVTLCVLLHRPRNTDTFVTKTCFAEFTENVISFNNIWRISVCWKSENKLMTVNFKCTFYVLCSVFNDL